eukprot:CAMPEP_0168306492 /NCGR_PEP_ID=MMETSP0142_2-20121227/54418_1 /TAXON_ID=44445 /ORGANISM="Pseudo-nitzschia australis, Strain 10249 10 AB" /LENGTH=430 /DNA_ID=CAMNT_0008258291 /DNA_START=144 /DNA_END=1439 /DNA_ORIENTATION=-
MTSSPSVLGGEEELSTESKQQHHHQQRHQQQRIQGCTCREPTSVNFLDGNDTDEHETNRNIFLENLRTHGWSSVVVSNAPNPSPSQEEILAIFRRRKQRGDSSNSNSSCQDVVYIPSESGSSEGTVEPKESLEVQLSKCSFSKGNEQQQLHDKDEMTVKTFCWTLSWIAHKICSIMLDMPPNLLLPDDPNESLDLLRVFHYYPVATNMTTSSSSCSTFGSSEHTDWGSLTVVWQDTVGGLQTYCRACKKWINVRADAEATTTESTKGKKHRQSHRWKCIVHVGDMASLVLDKCSNGDAKKKVIDSSTMDNDTAFQWPSPKHRVVSPARKERVSLVYFGYPPRRLSLHRIQTILNNGWKYSSTRGRRLPLEEYYLLRNQSAATNANVDDGRSDRVEDDAESSHLYRTIWDLPIQDIVRLKWKQVNREQTTQ